MYKSKKAAYAEAVRVLAKGSLYPMKPVITTYGSGKKKLYNFNFTRL